MAKTATIQEGSHGSRASHVFMDFLWVVDVFYLLLRMIFGLILHEYTVGPADKKRHFGVQAQTLTSCPLTSNIWCISCMMFSSAQIEPFSAFLVFFKLYAAITTSHVDIVRASCNRRVYYSLLTPPTNNAKNVLHIRLKPQPNVSTAWAAATNETTLLTCRCSKITQSSLPYTLRTYV